MADRQDEIVSLVREILKNISSGSIIETDELPDAEKNRNKFIRLTSDNGLYVSDYKGSTSTNRLPDAQQIDKAYLYDSGGGVAYYNGFLKLICDDGEISGYVWFYNGNTEAQFTLDNAENILTDSKFAYLDMSEWQISGDIAIGEGYSVEDIRFNPLSDNDIIPIPAIYNASESAQIGNAYIEDDNAEFEYYTGEEINVIVSDGSIKLYEWKLNNNISIYTNKKASDIYGKIWQEEDLSQLHTLTDFLHTSSVSLIDDGFIKSGNTYTNLNKTIDEIELITSGDIDLPLYGIYIPQLNAPDEEQVGNAYLLYDGDNFYYKGTALISDGTQTVTAYRWQQGEVDEGYNNRFTVLPASKIFSANDNYFSNYGDWHLENGIYKDDGWDVIKLSESDIVPHIIKYQRTEGIWEWRKI